jgi:hypothetical protein
VTGAFLDPQEGLQKGTAPRMKKPSTIHADTNTKTTGQTKHATKTNNTWAALEIKYKTVAFPVLGESGQLRR